jgi:hypothetical protein
MFANIKRKKLKILKRDYRQRYTLICELIEPANAEHKQRTKYLASIAEDILTDGFWREQFWLKIDSKLKRLKVSPEVERTARAKINKSVPRPSIENQ